MCQIQVIQQCSQVLPDSSLAPMFKGASTGQTAGNDEHNLPTKTVVDALTFDKQFTVRLLRVYRFVNYGDMMYTP